VPPGTAAEELLAGLLARRVPELRGLSAGRAGIRGQSGATQETRTIT
jgi:hypothetical protein